MEEYNRQLKNNQQEFIYEFNNDPQYAKIRTLYKMHFDSIVTFIQKFGYGPAIEDISNIDQTLSQSIMENRLLLIQINKAIFKQELGVGDIK